MTTIPCPECHIRGVRMPSCDKCGGVGVIGVVVANGDPSELASDFEKTSRPRSMLGDMLRAVGDAAKKLTRKLPASDLASIAHTPSAANNSPPGEAPAATPPKQETTRMNPLETFLLPALGAVVTMNQANINAIADSAAEKVVAAVRDSETKFDDFAATELARVFERIAAKVRADLAAPAPDAPTA